MTGEKGVLLPISCLDGFGKDAYKFVDYLVKWRQQYWQVLPICPRDRYGSPYDSPASMEIDPEYGTKVEWLALKKYANKNGIKIIGDLSFFVGKGSKECLSNQDLFLTGQFSGVSQDAYNRRNGQYWGQYQYNWEKLEQTGFKFFLERFESAIDLYDLIRLDHFRGYEAVWSIPEGYKSGRKGKWVNVPGEKLFKTAQKKFGSLPFFAEDLGFITPEVEALRKEFGFLGTRVVQFGNTDEKDIIFYTGTHDTPTLVGFTGKRRSKKLIEKVLNSNAKIKMITVPDLLLLDNKARFNRPGSVKNNWKWKLDISTISPNSPQASGQWCTFPL